MRLGSKAAVKRAQPETTKWGLDVGIKRNELYFEDCKAQPLRTYATAGHAQMRPQNMQKKPIVEPQRAIEDSTPIGSKVTPLDDSRQRRKDVRKQATDRLEKWFGLPKQQITPELELELKAIQLRKHFDPKRFYKSNDSNKLPTHFHVGVVTYEGGLRAVGGGRESEALNAHTGKKKYKGTSLLQEILANEKSCAWTREQFNSVSVRGNSGVKKTKKVTKKNWKRKKH
eukprot:GEMP01099840.1.p1 GENE.GEMP01099840.1~~GEMP01099840.1.p1  ORF type:complete len:228 (-),score=49.47 GEMP01099840.1:29-712(-)